MLLRGHLCSLPIVVESSRDHHHHIVILISVICNWYCPTSHIQQLSLKTSYTSCTLTPSMVTIADWQRLTPNCWRIIACAVVVIHIFSLAAGIQSNHEHHGAPVSIRVAIINHHKNHSQRNFWRPPSWLLTAEYGMVHEGSSSEQFTMATLLAPSSQSHCAHSDFTNALGESSSPFGGFSIATMLCRSHSCRSWHCNYMQHATTIISLEMSGNKNSAAGSSDTHHRPHRFHSPIPIGIDCHDDATTFMRSLWDRSFGRFFRRRRYGNRGPWGLHHIAAAEDHCTVISSFQSIAS